MLKKVLFSLTFILCGLVNAQTTSNASVIWEETYLPEKNATINSVTETRDKGFVLAISIAYDSTGDLRFRSGLLKVDAKGKQLWYKEFRTRFDNHFYKVTETKDGGIAVIGVAEKDFNRYDLLWFFKTDKNGNVLWEQKFGGGGYSARGKDLVEAPDGGFYLIGTSTHILSETGITKDVWLLKTKKTGDIEWDKKMGDKLDDEGIAIALTPRGDILTLAVKNSNPATEFGEVDLNKGCWVNLLDKNGNVIYNKFYSDGKSYPEIPTAFCQPNDTSVVILMYGGEYKEQGLFTALKMYDTRSNKKLNENYFGQFSPFKDTALPIAILASPDKEFNILSIKLHPNDNNVGASLFMAKYMPSISIGYSVFSDIKITQTWSTAIERGKGLYSNHAIYTSDGNILLTGYYTTTFRGQCIPWVAKIKSK